MAANCHYAQILPAITYAVFILLDSIYRGIFSQLHLMFEQICKYPVYNIWAVCFQFTHFFCGDWENIYTLSYYHHQIGSMNYYPLFSVRSWNNGMRSMSFYILLKRMVFPFLHLFMISSRRVGYISSLSAPVYKNGLTFITSYICYHFATKALGEITYPLANCSVDVRELISNVVTHFTGHVITVSKEPRVSHTYYVILVSLFPKYQ